MSNIISWNNDTLSLFLPFHLVHLTLSQRLNNSLIFACAAGRLSNKQLTVLQHFISFDSSSKINVYIYKISHLKETKFNLS